MNVMHKLKSSKNGSLLFLCGLFLGFFVNVSNITGARDSAPSHALDHTENQQDHSFRIPNEQQANTSDSSKQNMAGFSKLDHLDGSTSENDQQIESIELIDNTEKTQLSVDYFSSDGEDLVFSEQEVIVLLEDIYAAYNLDELGNAIDDLKSIASTLDPEFVENVAQHLISLGSPDKRELAFDLMSLSTHSSVSFQNEVLNDVSSSTDNDSLYTAMNYFSNTTTLDTSVLDKVLLQASSLAYHHSEDVQERALATLINHGKASEVAALVSDKLDGSYSDNFKFDLINQIMLQPELSRNAHVAYRVKEIANNPNASAKLRISALSIMDFEEEYLLP